jgi:ppGpp synthetase/RelA/SpoT-type nucleotidyltranferase
MDEGRRALLEQLRHFHSLIRAEDFDVAAFLSLFSRIFGCDTVCILQLRPGERGDPCLHTVYHAAGTDPLDEIGVNGEEVFSVALDSDEFVLLGAEHCTYECPKGLQDQGIVQCILGPIDVVEVTKELIVIGSRSHEVLLSQDDVLLAEMLSYFLSLKFVERQLQKETQILERAADFGFNLSLRKLRGLKIDLEFLERIHQDLLWHDLTRSEAENQLKIFKVLNELEGHYFIRDVRSRTKSFESVLEKMVRSGRPYETFDDLAGVRVILDYLSDFDQVISFIEGNKTFRLVKMDDKIHQAGYGGYRGYHITVEVCAPYLVRNDAYPLCEIQIRTSYQDSWSTKTHELTYKREPDIPDHLLSLVELLSDQLFTADRQSEVLRKSIEDYIRQRERRGEERRYAEEEQGSEQRARI